MTRYTVVLKTGERTSLRSERVFTKDGLLSFFNHDRSTVAAFAPGEWSSFHREDAQK